MLDAFPIVPRDAEPPPWCPGLGSSRRGDGYAVRPLRGLFLLLSLALVVPGARAGSGAAVEKVGFSLRFRGLTTADRIVSAFLLPGERLEMEVAGGTGTFTAVSSDGGMVLEDRLIRWRAPQSPGLVRAEVADARRGDVMALHLFVLVPVDSIQGFELGSYPSIPLRGLDAYLPPRGFVRVTPEMHDTPVSPHFRLGQFLCKQEGGYPKYLALQERLLHKLEAILEEANARGLCTESFHVMSGYRTPWYNRAIGNTTTYSRHLYGDAADIFVDEDRDEWMDDLDGDGRADEVDMEILASVVERVERDPAWRDLSGGVGRYEENAHHGPFVHVDTRGFPARW